MALLTGLAIGGGVLRAFSGISKGRAQKRLAEERAEQKRFQQLEIQRRTDSEIQLIRDRAKGTVGLGITRFAGSGVDVSSGAVVQAQMQSFENLGRTILNKRLEAKFRNTQLSAEERWARKQGSDLQNASIINAFGSLISTGVQISNAMPSSGGGELDILGGDSVIDAGFSTTGMEGVV